MTRDVKTARPVTPCPEPEGAFSAWQSLPAAALVLTALAVVEFVLAVRLERLRAVPVVICLLAMVSAATVASPSWLDPGR